jgi:hypothetical protein
MAENLTDLNEQFDEKESRNASFKFLFNVLNTTTHKTIDNEEFYKGFSIFPDEIIFESNTIIQDPQLGPDFTSLSGILPSRIRTWVTGSTGGTNKEKLIRGHFSTSIYDTTGANPYVEKIICPLTKLKGANDQFYSVFAAESQSQDYYNGLTDSNPSENYNTKEIESTILFSSQSSILKNFISPFKFGGNYKALFFASNDNYDSYDPNKPLTGFDPDNDSTGILFDYREGGLFVGSLTGGDDPDLNKNTSNNSTLFHPIWIEAYRYYGPVGVSGPQHNITASNVQIDNNLNVDGAITLQGLSFASVSALNSSGSSTFGSGSDPSTTTHEFTGSVSITGSLLATASHALTASFATNAGQSGITPIMISSSFHDEVNGDYDITTLTPTDGEDIIEYKPTSIGFLLSSSIGPSEYITLIGSKSAATITMNGSSGPLSFNPGGYSSPIRSVGTSNISINDMPHNGWNGGDRFKYTHQDKDYPDFSSYGAFAHTESISEGKRYTTQSFRFPTPIKIDKIGLWYSRGSSVDPRQDFDPTDPLVDPYVGTFNPVSNYIDEIQLSGSTDGTTWVGLLEKTNMNAERTGSNPIISSSVIFTGDPRWSNTIPSIDEGIGMVHFTSSKLNVPEYQYYKLHAHGGAANLGVEGYLYHYIHHIDIYQDKNFGKNNRKQINIGFDHSTQDGELFTNFQLAVSSAAGVLGFEGYTLPANQAVVGGTAQRNVDMNNNDLLNVDDLDADSITTNTLTVNGNSFFSDQNSLLQNQNLLEQYNNIYMGFGAHDGFPSFPSQSIVLKELNPIYFTNQKQDGSPGVDQFSAKIFGHYTTEGVSDLYLDAFRIYKVADKEIRLTTLHPKGLTHITSSQIWLDGNVTASNISASGTINASEYLLNGLPFTGDPGGGSGFPHNQITTQITASITGSLSISGSQDSHIPFIEFGNIDEGFNTPIKTLHSLYVMNDTLYFGDNPVVSLTEDDATTGNFNGTFTGGLTGNVTGDVLASDGTIILDSGTNGIDASFTGTASRANSSSVAISSSYAITSSFANSSSAAISSSYALSSSFARSSSYAESSSYTESSSFAITSSYVVSSSHAVTASHLFTQNLHIPGTLSTVNHENLDTTINNIADELHWHLYDDNTTISSSKNILVQGNAQVNHISASTITASNIPTVDKSNYILGVSSSGEFVKIDSSNVGSGGSGGSIVLSGDNINIEGSSQEEKEFLILDWVHLSSGNKHVNTHVRNYNAGPGESIWYSREIPDSFYKELESGRLNVGTDIRLKFPDGDISDHTITDIDPPFPENSNQNIPRTISFTNQIGNANIPGTYNSTTGQWNTYSYAGLYIRYNASTVSTVGLNENISLTSITASGGISASGDITTTGNISGSALSVNTITSSNIPNVKELPYFLGLSSSGEFLKSDNIKLTSTPDSDISLEIRNKDIEGETKINTVSLKFGHKAESPAGKIVAGKDSYYTTNNNFYDSNLQFWTTLNNVDTEQMRITSNGRVGIGTTNPQQSLTVKGDISASGDLFVKGIAVSSDTSYNTVMVDTTTGQLHYTGSYGGGGGGDTTTIIHEGVDDDWGINDTYGYVTSSRNVIISNTDHNSPHIRINLNDSSVISNQKLGEIIWSSNDAGPNNSIFTNHSLTKITAKATEYHNNSTKGGTELIFSTTKKGTITSNEVMTVNSDDGVTIDNDLLVKKSKHEEIIIGDFSRSTDAFLNVRTDGGVDTFQNTPGFNNFAGMKFRHDNESYGFTIQSQDGPATTYPHGLNILSHADDWNQHPYPLSITESRFFIDRIDGKVGIGTIFPEHKLEVVGSAKIQNSLDVEGKSGNAGEIFITKDETTTSPNEYMGGIGFNSTDGGVPDNLLASQAYIAAYAGGDINGGNKSGYLSIGVGGINKNLNTISTEVIRVATDQRVHFADDIIAFSSTISDKRLKTNIKPLTGSLDTVCNLEGVRYDWKFKDSGPQLGVIAQQVEQYTPEVIKTTQLPLHASSSTDVTEYKTVQYEQFVPHLIEAIKELKNEVDNLKQQLKDAK